MKKGISIWSFGGMPLEKVFEKASKSGYEGVELALAETGEINFNTSEKQLLAIKNSAENNGLKTYSLATGLFWQYSLTSDDKNHREKAKQVAIRQLECAAILRCDTILTVPGAVSVSFAPDLGVVNYETAYNRSLEAYNELSSYAKQFRVNIGIENVWNNFLLSPLEMRDFIDKVNCPYIGSYFDVGNVLQTGYPEHWIQILGKRIKKVHFKDYKIGQATLSGFTDLLSGDVNYPAVMQALTSINYDDWVSAEMIPPYTHHSQAIIDTTSVAMDYILGRRK